MRPNTRDSFTAYDRGSRAFYRGKSFQSNPYKIPGSHIEWAQGWLESKKRPKTGVINIRMWKYYSTAKKKSTR